MSCPWKAADAPNRATNFHSASAVMPMESSRCPHSSNRFLSSLFACQQTQSKQPTAAKMVPDSKGVEQEQVWHQVNNAAVGLELMEQMWFGIVLQKNNQKMHH